MKFPLPRNIFPAVNLPPQEAEALENYATNVVRETRDYYHNFLTTRHGQVDPSEWKKLKQQDSFALLDGTVEDCMLGLRTPTSQSMQLKSAMVEDGYVDWAVLGQLVKPSPSQPFHEVAVKWAVKAHPFLVGTVMRVRDIVYVETTGFTTITGLDGIKQPLGYHLKHSVDLPGVHELTEFNIVRARLSYCYLYRQRSERVVDVFLRGFVCAMGEAPELLVVSTVTEIVMSIPKNLECARLPPASRDGPRGGRETAAASGGDREQATRKTAEHCKVVMYFRAIGKGDVRTDGVGASIVGTRDMRSGKAKTVICASIFKVEARQMRVSARSCCIEWLSFIWLRAKQPSQEPASSGIAPRLGPATSLFNLPPSDQPKTKTTMPVRNARYAFEAERRVVETARYGGVWEAVVERLGVKINTARDWVRRHVARGEPLTQQLRGGKRDTKMTGEMVNFLLSKLRDDPDLTLRQLVDMLELETGVSVVPQTVKNHVDAFGFTLKQLHKDPLYMNTMANKAETPGVSRQASALTGRRAFKKVFAGGGQNMHVFACISEHGLVYYETRFGSNRFSNTNDFIRNVLRHVRDASEIRLDNVVLVLDNAPCHCRAEVVFEETEFLDATLLRLGPYSPMLNPIENVFSTFKSAVKAFMRERRLEILRVPEGVTMKDHRRLLRALWRSKSIPSATLQDWGNLIASAALQRQGGVVIEVEADCQDLRMLNRLDEILAVWSDDAVARVSPVTTRSRARSRSRPTAMQAEVVRELRVDRIRKAQDEEVWIAGMKKYLRGTVADLTQDEAQSYGNIAADYELDSNDLLFYCAPSRRSEADRDGQMRNRTHLSTDPRSFPLERPVQECTKVRG
ncbi:hypothetical protein ON010_g12200 [Phytophthora cinnamomi]|nr:hypothetical protein ON010_g12200 [Phytophthora cinnamomi]